MIEGHLDWNKVVEELDKRARAIQDAEDTPTEDDNTASETTTISKPNEENAKYVEKDATGWLIAAYIFAILGGFLGIILGTVVATGKVEMVSGEKIYKYKSDHRRLGWGAAILSIISMVVWKFVILV